MRKISDRQRIAYSVRLKAFQNPAAISNRLSVEINGLHTEVESADFVEFRCFVKNVAQGKEVKYDLNDIHDALGVQSVDDDAVEDKVDEGSHDLEGILVNWS